MVNFKQRLFVLVFVIGFLRNSCVCQNLEGLYNLIGGKWTTQTKWNSGSNFRQEILFEWGLDSLMIKTKVFGFIDKEGKVFGLRNEGIRFFDQTSKTIRFWEFDVFGEVTEGICMVEGKNIHYEYPYVIDGIRKILRDSWLYVSPDLYQFKVGIFENGKWEKVFLETSFTRIEQ